MLMRGRNYLLDQAWIAIIRFYLYALEAYIDC